jgi:hypothetical protein
VAHELLGQCVSICVWHWLTGGVTRGGHSGPRAAPRGARGRADMAAAHGHGRTPRGQELGGAGGILYFFLTPPHYQKTKTNFSPRAELPYESHHGRSCRMRQ